MSYEQTILQLRECFVYKVPPLKGGAGYKAKEWDLGNPLWQGQLAVKTKGDQCNIRLLNADGSEFAVCPVNVRKTGPSSVEKVLDSSRYFAMRISDGRGATAVIGLGFNERSDAFDFSAALMDHEKSIRQERELKASRKKRSQQPAKDYSLAAGKTISISLKASTKKNEEEDSTSSRRRRRRRKKQYDDDGDDDDALFSLAPPPGSKAITTTTTTTTTTTASPQNFNIQSNNNDLLSTTTTTNQSNNLLFQPNTTTTTTTTTNDPLFDFTPTTTTTTAPPPQINPMMPISNVSIGGFNQLQTNTQPLQPFQTNTQPLQPFQTNTQPLQPFQTNTQPLQPFSTQNNNNNNFNNNSFI